jgi:Flp pilus assembly protein TadG
MTGHHLRNPLGPRDRGSVALELSVLTPVMLLLIAFVVLAGRMAMAGNAVTGVAGNAAREASLARTPSAAAAAGATSARAGLAAQAVRCQGGGGVSVDVSGFGAAARGVPGQTVAVTVTCVVDLSDLTIPGVPGTRTLSEQAISPIDPNRGGR